MSTETKFNHDPDFPILVVGNMSNNVVGKFPDLREATLFLYEKGDDSYHTEDTTPEPPIPADVSYIFWVDSNRYGNYARRLSDGRWQIDSGSMFINEEALLEDIGEGYTIYPLDIRPEALKR